MKTFDELHICSELPVKTFHENSKPPVPGAKMVIGKIGGEWRAAGWLMPTVFDSRQQPKSDAFLLREKLNESSF